MKQLRLFKTMLLMCLLLSGISNAWGEGFSKTYEYGLSDWNLTNYTDQSTYYQVPTGTNVTTSVATIAGIFKDKIIDSDIVVTINCATYGSGTNPSASTFSLYKETACTNAVAATQGGTLPTSSTYTNVTYTVTTENAKSFIDDLAIKITKPGKTIRLKSIKIEFSYTTDSSTPLYHVYFDDPITGGTIFSNPKSAIEGETITLSAIPNGGYSFNEWNVTRVDNEERIFVNNNQFIMPNANVKVSATFIEGAHYKLVSSPSDLVSGCKYVIATKAYKGQSTPPTDCKFMSVNYNTGDNNIQGTEYKMGVSSTEIIIPERTLILQLEGTTDHWSFKATNYSTGDFYLNYTSSTSNYLKLLKDNDKYRFFGIGISNDIAKISCIEKEGYEIRHNTQQGKNLFATYQGTQQSVYLYKEVTNELPVPTLSLAPSVIDFGTVDKGAEVASQTIIATLANTTDAIVKLDGKGASAFSITPYSLSQNGNITITPITSAIGNYEATLTLVADGATPVTANIKMTVEDSSTPFAKEDASFAYTVHAKVGSQFQGLTFSNNLGAPATYSSDNTDVAEVDPSTGKVTIGEATGTAVITYTVAGTEAVNETSQSYTIIVE